MLGAIGTGREKAVGVGVGTRRDDWDRGALAVRRGSLAEGGGVTVAVFTAVGLADRPLNDVVTTCGRFDSDTGGAGLASFPLAATGDIRTGRSRGAAGRISTGFFTGATTESLLTTLSTWGEAFVISIAVFICCLLATVPCNRASLSE